MRDILSKVLGSKTQKLEPTGEQNLNGNEQKKATVVREARWESEGEGGMVCWLLKKNNKAEKGPHRLVRVKRNDHWGTTR